MRFALLSALLACVPAAAENPPATPPPARFVIGISPYLDNGVKDEVYRSVVRLVVQDLPLYSTLAVYDAFNLKSITQLALPKSSAFESPKTRANQFAAAIHDLRQFLAQTHAKPSVAGLKFEGSLRLPQFCDFLAENLPDTGAPVTLLLIGSPLYQDEKEPGFSMVDGYFPSDGHLRASREKSIFGISQDAGAHQRWIVHWVYFGDPWASDLYREKLTRFWTLYLERRGADLVSFCADFPTAAQAFKQGAEGLRAPVHHWSVGPEQTRVEMLRVGREVEVADWIERDSVGEISSKAPLVMFGPMKIGIRWKDNIDLDLYASPSADGQTLFFQHPRSPEGYYYKDHRSSPGKDYEFIEFDTPVDIRRVEAFVNFYKGSCSTGPRGEVRIEFDGRIYSAPFSIVATRGNRGRTGASQEAFWDRIPVQDILKLARPTP